MLAPALEIARDYKFPFTFRKDQIETINTVCDRGWRRSAIFMDVGTGKTAVSTACAFYFASREWLDQVIVVMPPILLNQWRDWLETFPDLDITTYTGSPAARAKLNLNADFVLMTFGIFKNDYAKLKAHFGPRKVMLLVDEAAAIRNISTQIYKAVRDFVDLLPHKLLMMLTGTAINNPVHAYAYIRLKTPTVYASMRQFQMLHIEREDFWGNPVSFKNLELLTDNLMLQAVRVIADEVLDLPEVTTCPIKYDLSPKHLKLYKKVVDEELATLDDGELLDGTTVQRLRHTIQRIILRPMEFGGDAIEPTGFELIESMAGELGMLSGSKEKLIIYANYITSNQAITEHARKIGLNPIQAYGELGPAKNMKNVGRFLREPDLNVLVAHPRSIGIGLNLQSVCRALLFLELPLTSGDYTQALGRVKREGQQRPIIAKLAVANHTIQVDIARNIVKKEDVVQMILPTKDSLRGALYGD